MLYTFWELKFDSLCVRPFLPPSNFILMTATNWSRNVSPALFFQITCSKWLAGCTGSNDSTSVRYLRLPAWNLVRLLHLKCSRPETRVLYPVECFCNFRNVWFPSSSSENRFHRLNRYDLNFKSNRFVSDELGEHVSPCNP